MALGRKILYDQDKVKELRMKIIVDSLFALNDGDVSKWSQYKRDLILRYAPKVLPQLNAGRDDDERLFPQPLLGGLTNDQSNHSNEETSETKEED
jgi:hypothetical protein